MGMTQEEKIAVADMVRSHDRFGPVSPEELAALPGKEQELWIQTKNGKRVHVFEERPGHLPDLADPLCSPAFAKDQALAAFPDCLILSAGEDSLREDTEAFGMRLAKAGVCVTIQRIPEAMHGFTTNRTHGWSRALERQYQFFQEHLR